MITQNDDVTESDDILAMDYNEYLRLLLVQVPHDVKLYRIQDLIELNIYKETNTKCSISDYYTQISCNAGYSINTFVYINAEGERRYCCESSICAGTT